MVIINGDGSDNNNGGNNNVDGRTYSLEGHIQGLSLTSSQHYGVEYGYDHKSQLERSTRPVLLSLLIIGMIMMMIVSHSNSM